MKKISQLFLQGLLAVLPVVLTIYIVYWLGSLAESTLGQLIKLILPYDWYIPGMGILAGFGVILAVGILLKAYIFRKVAGAFEHLLERIPLIKTVYGSIRDIAKFASAGKDEDLQKTVLVTMDDDIKVMGFITQRSPSIGLEDPNQGAKNNSSLIAVYIPMSYQIGGFTIMVPESRLDYLEMSAQDAMRFIVTAGMADTSK